MIKCQQVSVGSKDVYQVGEKWKIWNFVLGKKMMRPYVFKAPLYIRVKFYQQVFVKPNCAKIQLIA